MSLKILKKTYSKNKNEIDLIGWGDFCSEGQKSPLKVSNQKTILIIGVVHGDEPQGKFLIENYLNIPPPQPSPSRGEGAKLLPPNFSVKEIELGTEALPPPPLRGRGEFQNEERVLEIRVGGKNRLLFIPCLNPDGLDLKTRQNANGVDLNRNFPTENWEVSNNPEYFGGEMASSEIETKFVTEILEEFSTDVILTLHAPYKVVNYDGPAKEIAQKFSDIIGYPVSNDIGYPTPGSFGTYAGVERNIPIITLELNEEIDVKELIAPVNKIFDYLADM